MRTWLNHALHLKLLYLCSKLLHPQDLEETEHFRRWRQEKVTKIVHYGEPRSDKAIWNSFQRPLSLPRNVRKK